MDRFGPFLVFAAGALMRTLLSSPRHAGVFNGVMGAALAASVLMIV
jgi:hypothetical protein